MDILSSLIYFLITLYYLVVVPTNACPSFSTSVRGTLNECKGKEEKFSNLPIVSGAYCYNNGSYLCKVLSGRFEFYYDSKTDEILGPAKKSDYVDEFGYHARVPVSYNVKGEVNYVDKSINWAKFFVESKNGTKFNILSTKSFNWCIYTEKDWWPYKSSFSWRQYHIYFYNRQSCIYDTIARRRQHFNTRFLQKSNLRIDLDYNPTIFAMEDPIATSKKIRLVKHKRQHWYEVTFDVLEKPTGNISYFIDMQDTEERPLKLNGSTGLFTAKTYRKYSDICIDDGYIRRTDKNGNLVMHWCGIDEVEISDIPKPVWAGRRTNYEVDLHNLPRWPVVVELFYDVHVRDDSDWIEFAKDGYTFSATTTIPIDEKRVRIIMLLSSFNTNEAGRYNENYPAPILADITGTYDDNEEKWDIKRDYSNRVRDLNYVDDIAYLYKCQTILVILGPLYTELSPTNFSIDSTGYIGSIADLGIYELANSFFNEPDTDILWVYHRTNYVVSVRYKCGKLVTASKIDGKYYSRHGNTKPSVFVNGQYPYDYDYCEECFFKSLNIYNGSTNRPEAPDPKLYPLKADPIISPEQEKDSLFMWIIVGIGIVIILLMAVVCVVTMRNRRLKARRQAFLSKTIRSGTSELEGLERKTGRSSLATQGERLHAAPTLRSGIPSHSSTASGKTRRTSMGGSISKANNKSMKTSRSALAGRGSNRSTSTRRSSTGRG